MVDLVEETNRFFDHNAARVDAIASAMVSSGSEPNSFVILVIDASQGTGRRLATLLAKEEGKALDELFADVGPDEDPTVVTTMDRTVASILIATWNSGVAQMIGRPPQEARAYWVIVMTAGVTRAFDRLAPSAAGIA